MIRSGLLTGSAGEALLTPPGPRLAFEKLFLFGTGGTRSGFDPAARIVEALEKLSRAGVREAALQLPSGAAGEACVRALLEDEQAPARGLAFTADPARLVEALSESGAARPPDRRVVKVQQAARAATAAKPAPSSDPGARAGPQRYVPPPPRPSKKGR